MCSHDTLPHVTISVLQKLALTRGVLQIQVQIVRGLYVPFVFHTAPQRRRAAYGPILSDSHIVAAHDLEGLIDALRDSLGQKIKIYAPDSHDHNDQVWQ